MYGLMHNREQYSKNTLHCSVMDRRILSAHVVSSGGPPNPYIHHQSIIMPRAANRLLFRLFFNAAAVAIACTPFSGSSQQDPISSPHFRL